MEHPSDTRFFPNFAAQISIEVAHEQASLENPLQNEAVVGAKAFGGLTSQATAPKMTRAGAARLRSCDWPGNVKVAQRDRVRCDSGPVTDFADWAVELLGIKSTTLRFWMNKLDLKRPARD